MEPFWIGLEFTVPGYFEPEDAFCKASKTSRNRKDIEH